jgi:DNA-binding IclR family transcriptional regulator
MKSALIPAIAVLRRFYQDEPKEYTLPIMLTLLELFESHPKRLTKTEVSQATGLPAQDIWRTLTKLGEWPHKNVAGSQMLLVDVDAEERYGLTEAAVNLRAEIMSVVKRAA